MYLPYCQVVPTSDTHATVRGTCVVTGAPYEIENVPLEEIRSYRAGALIQDAFPTLSSEQREFLISGTSPMGWKATFGDGSDEAYEDDDHYDEDSDELCEDL